MNVKGTVTLQKSLVCAYEHKHARYVEVSHGQTAARTQCQPTLGEEGETTVEVEAICFSYSEPAARRSVHRSFRRQGSIDSSYVSHGFTSVSPPPGPSPRTTPRCFLRQFCSCRSGFGQKVHSDRWKRTLITEEEYYCRFWSVARTGQTHESIK